jgi:hypothetical protein
MRGFRKTGLSYKNFYRQEAKFAKLLKSFFAGFSCLLTFYSWRTLRLGGKSKCLRFKLVDFIFYRKALFRKIKIKAVG